MAIHEMYQAETMTEVMDICMSNCAHCTGKCKNINCLNIRALMNNGEKKEMTKDEKKRYFEIVGG